MIRSLPGPIMTFAYFFTALYALNAIDIDHAFDLGQDTGFINSLTIHTFHIYGGFILASFILMRLSLIFRKHVIGQLL